MAYSPTHSGSQGAFLVGKRLKSVPLKKVFAGLHYCIIYRIILEFVYNLIFSKRSDVIVWVFIKKEKQVLGSFEG